MARRIRAVSVEQLLTDAGHEFSNFDAQAAEWDPGVRVTQAGPRQVNVFWDGPGEADQLEVITVELRGEGYHVVLSQQDRGGRRRLEVTRP